MLLTEYYSSHQTNKDEMGGTWGMHGKKVNTFIALMKKPEGNRTLGSPRHRWEYNIKIDLNEDLTALIGFVCLRINVSDWLL
jgi:hypothetical protein